MIVLFILIQIATILSSHFTNIEKIAIFALSFIIFSIIFVIKKESEKKRKLSLLDYL